MESKLRRLYFVEKEGRYWANPLYDPKVGRKVHFTTSKFSSARVFTREVDAINYAKNNGGSVRWAALMEPTEKQEVVSYTPIPGEGDTRWRRRR